MCNFPHLFHKFPKWETLNDGQVGVVAISNASKTMNDVPIGMFMRQRRVCERCGIVKLRQETVKLDPRSL